MKTFSKTPTPDESSREVSCAVCGANQAPPHWDCGTFAFVRCARCGHHYQNPQPDATVLIDRYDDEYLEYEVDNAHNFLDLMLKGLSDVNFFPRMARLHTDLSILDIGCATGMLLSHARELGYRVHGVEVCEPAARYAAEVRGVPVSLGTLDKVGLDPGSFTSVHFSHVIEHVPDPRDFLHHVHRVMAPGALGVLVTPNTAGLQARLFGARWRSAIADHVHLFSRRNLVRLLGETGFSVIETKTWGGLGVGTAPGWLKSPIDRLAKVFGFGDVVLVLFTPAPGSTSNEPDGHS